MQALEPTGSEQICLGGAPPRLAPIDVRRPVPRAAPFGGSARFALLQAGLIGAGAVLSPVSVRISGVGASYLCAKAGFLAAMSRPAADPGGWRFDRDDGFRQGSSFPSSPSSLTAWGTALWADLAAAIRAGASQKLIR